MIVVMIISGLLSGFILNLVISSLSKRGTTDVLRMNLEIVSRYPLFVVTLNGLLWGVVYYQVGFTLTLMKALLLVSLLLMVTVIDIREQIIPDKLMIFGFLTGIVFLLIPGLTPLYGEALVGMLVGSGLFMLIALLSKGAMGGGDVKLMGVLGLWLGWQLILLVSFLAFVLGAIVSLGLIASGRKNKKDYIPFGPFIALASLLSCLWGKGLIIAYFWLLRV